MRIITKLFCSIVLLTCLTSCEDEDETRDLVQQLKTSYDYDWQEVELVGYIAMPKAQAIKNGKVYVQLEDEPSQHSGELGELEICYGKEANQIYFPSNYTFSSIQIYDAEGVVYNFQTKIKITGVVNYPFKNWKDIIDDLKFSSDNQAKTSSRVSQRAIEIKKQMREKAIKDALKREKSTGDLNDYTYYIIVEKIEVIE